MKVRQRRDVHSGRKQIELVQPQKARGRGKRRKGNKKVVLQQDDTEKKDKGRRNKRRKAENESAVLVDKELPTGVSKGEGDEFKNEEVGREMYEDDGEIDDDVEGEMEELEIKASDMGIGNEVSEKGLVSEDDKYCMEKKDIEFRRKGEKKVTGEIEVSRDLVDTTDVDEKDILDVTMCVQTEVVTVDILERLVRAGAYGRGGFSFNGKVASLKKVGECFDCVVDSLEKTVEFVKEVKALTMNSLRKSRKKERKTKKDADLLNALVGVESSSYLSWYSANMDDIKEKETSC